MEGPEENEAYEKSFIEVPAILDKHKAAAAICDGKLNEYYHLKLSYLLFAQKFVNWKMINEVFFVYVYLVISNLTFHFIAALEKAIALCVDGAVITNICGEIDNYIVEEL